MVKRGVYDVQLRRADIFMVLASVRFDNPTNARQKREYLENGSPHKYYIFFAFKIHVSYQQSPSTSSLLR